MRRTVMVVLTCWLVVFLTTSALAMQKVWGIKLPANDVAQALTFSPHGNRLIIGTAKGELLIYGASADKAALWSDKPLFSGKVTGGAPITAVAFDPAQKILAIGSANGDLSFGSNTGLILKEIKCGKAIKQIVFSSDSSRALALCDSSTVKIINLPDFTVSEYEYKFFRPSVIAFGANSNEIIEALNNANGEIVKGNIEKNRATLKVYAQKFGIAAMAVNAAHNVIATSGADAEINFWSMEDLQFVSKIGTTDTFKKLTFDKEAQNIFGLCADGSLKIFETIGENQTDALYYGAIAQTFAVKPDARLMAVAFENSEVNVFSY